MPQTHLLRDIVTVLVLVAANGYFVATEFAMVRIRATQLRPLVKAGNWRARIAYRVTQNLDRFISAVQLGVTFTSLGLGWIGQSLVDTALGPYLAPYGAAHELLVKVISFVAAFGATSSLHIVFGELVPKTITLQRPRTVVLWFTPPLLVFYYVFFPLIWVLKSAANLVLRAVGLKPSHEEQGFSPEELRDVLVGSTHSHPSDVLINQIMIKALRLRETTAEQVMVPRDSVTFLVRDDPLEKNLAIAQRGGYSRMPVCGATKDEVVGIVMVKELLWQHMVLGAQTDIKALVRPALTFLPKTKLPTMLELFRKSRNHLAVVVDPADDRMLGIVSFEDVLEELVGDIRDEFDIEKGPFYELSEKSVLVDAGLPLRDLANETNWPLPTDTTKTVRQWVLDHFGRAPGKREQIDAEGFRIIAEEVGVQGLKRVRILRLEPKPEDAAEAELLQ